MTKPKRTLWNWLHDDLRKDEMRTIQETMRKEKPKRKHKCRYTICAMCFKSGAKVFDCDPKDKYNPRIYCRCGKRKP